MRFFATRTEAQIQEANEQDWQKHLLKQVRLRLRERCGIIRNKAELDLETAHERLGYRGSEIVHFKDVYLPALVAVKGLQESEDHDLMPEMHALQSDLTNHLTQAEQPMQEFSSADQAQGYIDNYLRYHASKDSIKTIAGELQPMSEIMDKIHDYLLSDIHQAKTPLEIIRQTHSCKACQLSPRQENKNQPKPLSNHFQDTHQSQFSKDILVNEAPVRQTLIELGLQNCHKAQKILENADLDSLPQQYLLNQTYIIENVLAGLAGITEIAEIAEETTQEPQTTPVKDTPSLTG